MLVAWTRSHVWHMKVLLYAVFKERGAELTEPPATASRKMSESRRLGGRALKAEQCSPDEGCACAPIVLRETLDVRAAQPTLKNVGLVVLIQPLAINGRVNPELRASSVVDLTCIRRCDRARRDPTTCTP